MVTGASRGIGRACALLLAHRGADLVLNDLSVDDDLNSLAAEMRQLGRHAHIACADVANAAAVEAMLSASHDALGPLDILINNAGWSVRKPFLEMPLKEARRTMDVSFWGSVYCSRAAAQQMLGRGGTIVMVSSVHAFRPYPNAYAYNAAKAALNHFAASLALELAPHRIRVNTVEPGWTDTPGERVHNTVEQIEERGQGLPMTRLARPEEVANAVAYLCSEEASYVTGSTLRVDGGFSLRF